MTSFATLDELKGRLDWTLDADEERIGTAALEDASDLARAFGRGWEDAPSAPRLVRTLVLKAAARYMRNPEGYTQSRAGDETLGWNDAAGHDAGTVYFSEDEQKLLAGLAGRAAGIVSVETFAWRAPNARVLREGLVPVDYEKGAPFPFFPTDQDNY